MKSTRSCVDFYLNQGALNHKNWTDEVPVIACLMVYHKDFQGEAVRNKFNMSIEVYYFASISKIMLTSLKVKIVIKGLVSMEVTGIYYIF